MAPVARPGPHAMTEPMKICICIPNSFGYAQVEFMMSLIAVQQYFYEWTIKNKREDTLSIILQGGHQLDKMRNDLVRDALAANQTHLLFLDADMAFPKELVPMLIEDFEDNPEVEAITGLYVWKSPPFLPHVYTTFDKKTLKFNMAGQFPLDTLFEVEGAGAGCLMVKAEALRRVEAPWFQFGAHGLEEFAHISSEEMPRIGEDLFFCLKVKPLMLCDPRIQCRHYRLANFDINTYIEHNGFTREGENFVVTSEQLDKISKEYTGGLAPDSAPAV